MCGIIGTWSSGAAHPVQRDWCAREIRHIAHRGPEAQNLLEGENFSFGHCLLSFHDRVDADQPYRSENGDLVVLFNGEIYNFNALRQLLAESGAVLTRNSECELIARLYRRHGLETCRLLRGMFALVIADQRKRRLVLARDYIGKKPLYFRSAAGVTNFASEAGPLMSLSNQWAINGHALQGYFLHNAVPAHECLVDGIDKVAPGELVVIGDGQKPERRLYWRFGKARDPLDIGFDQAAEQLTGLLRAAVHRRLHFQGDHLGILLSGGLDSSLISALAVREGARERQTTCFTATFAGDDGGDAEHAALVARHLSLPHEVVHLEPSAVGDEAQAHLGQLDEPIADPSFLLLAAITRRARGRYKAFLTGDGADDLFMGYALYRALRLLHALELIDPAGHLVQRLAGSGMLRGGGRDMGTAQVLGMLARAVGVPDGDKFAAATSAFNARELDGILSLRLKPAAQGSDPARGARAMRDGMLPGLLQARILSKLDRGSMLNGIELRSPFLDQEVTEYALRLPTRHMWHRGKGKRLVRAIARDHLPPGILDRPKRGFRLPLDRMLRGPLREIVCDTLSETELKRGGLFQTRPVGDLLAQHMSGKRDLGKKIWSLFCFQLWQRRWSLSNVR